MLSRALLLARPSLVRSLHLRAALCARLPSSSDNVGAWQQDTNRERPLGQPLSKKKSKGPFDEPLTDRSEASVSELSPDLKEKLSDAASKTRSKLQRSRDTNMPSMSGYGNSTSAGGSAKELHTLAFLRAPLDQFGRARPPLSQRPIIGDETAQDLKEDAKEEMSRLKSDLHELPELAHEAAEGIKEGASRVWNKVARAGKKVKAAAQEMASTETPASGDTWGHDGPSSASSSFNSSSLSEPAFAERSSSSDYTAPTTASGYNNFSISNPRSQVSSSSSGLASQAFSAEDLSSESNPVRHAARSETLSTSAPKGFVPSHASAEEAATGSASSMGLGQDSVRKSFFDGPQEMPEGVGKRARDADGKPMETGADRT